MIQFYCYIIGGNMKKVLLVVILVLLVIGSCFGYFKYKNYKQQKDEEKKHKQLVKEINDNYNKTVITNKETTFYTLNNKYEKKGKISKDYVLEIEKLENDDPYYKITGTDYYISYKDVDKYDQEITVDDRYTYFIPFDNNVVIENNKKIYLENGNYIVIDEKIDKPLLVKDDDHYGFVYLNKLFYVNKEDATLKENKNSEEMKAKKVLTLTYHFIYDPDEKSCNQSICQTISQFESHLKYLKENNYFVMKLSELEMYLDGKINIPYNSIVLTIDDGYISDKAIRLLEQYETYATLFVITGHFNDFSKFYSPYLDLQSHTDGMHKQYVCKGMGNQGGGILCAKEEDGIADLKLSQEKLGGSDKVVYLSYPFFDFNDNAVNILKKAGFRMGFIGQWNVKGFSTVGTNKYKIPRLTVFNDTTVEKLKQALEY